MTYPDSVEEKLGFDQIRLKLKAYCQSPDGETWVDRMRFGSEHNFVQRLLQQNFEFCKILQQENPFPSKHFNDPTTWLSKISVEGDWLEPEDFLALAYSLETATACCAFLRKYPEEYPMLLLLAEQVSVPEKLVRSVHHKIDDKAVVRDSASFELGIIRRKLREEQSRLRKLADSLFRQAAGEGWIPEGALPTIRDGRVVLPLLAEHKRRMKGFILDESATGQTVFLEPAEMLDANNEIRDLEHAEKREVVRILQALTDEFRTELDALRNAFRFLGQIDFIRAKARLSQEIKATMPILVEGPALDWRDARHPLLFLSLKDRRDVVPLTISLSQEERMLLVSGPNAGGKSVCLKTVGLLQYMVQCGLLIPLAEDSRVGLFDDLFLDIGDQQSIENDLSTYSSHLHNMRVFIDSASPRSILLLDELGSGTDPNFGGAIAEAVLEALLQKGVWGVATTHYYNLKLFASSHPGIRNGAMRFDEQRLVPRYELAIGKPGSSFALEIARSTGLPVATIRQAEQLVGKELAGFESVVRSLEKERQELRDRVRLLEEKEQELQLSRTKYQRLHADLEAKKKQIIEKAREDATALLKETNREIEKTIRHIKENKAEKKETQKVRRGLETLTEKVATKIVDNPVAESLFVGDRVRIIGQEGNGTVLSIQGKNATVQFGLLKSVTRLERLEKVTRSEEKAFERRMLSSGINLQEKRAHFNSTLDIRGKRVDEVTSMLDQFLDTAILLSQAELRILHGKGEGILRKVVRDHLKHYAQVESIRDEHVERGGDGITIVVLK
jgi:DNA mismatch repair protein MutS2